jgi:hypothetical protein
VLIIVCQQVSRHFIVYAKLVIRDNIVKLT